MEGFFNPGLDFPADPAAFAGFPHLFVGQLFRAGGYQIVMAQIESFHYLAQRLGPHLAGLVLVFVLFFRHEEFSLFLEYFSLRVARAYDNPNFAYHDQLSGYAGASSRPSGIAGIRNRSGTGTLTRRGDAPVGRRI